MIDGSSESFERRDDYLPDGYDYSGGMDGSYGILHAGMVGQELPSALPELAAGSNAYYMDLPLPTEEFQTAAAHGFRRTFYERIGAGLQQSALPETPFQGGDTHVPTGELSSDTDTTADSGRRLVQDIVERLRAQNPEAQLIARFRIDDGYESDSSESAVHVLVSNTDRELPPLR